MAALQEAPGVIAVCKKFRAAATALGSPQQEQLSTAQPQLHSDSSSSSSSNGDSDNSGSEAGSPRAAGTAGGSGSRGSSQAAELLVEIDVVADYGLTWIGRVQGICKCPASCQQKCVFTIISYKLLQPGKYD